MSHRVIYVCDVCGVESKPGSPQEGPHLIALHSQASPMFDVCLPCLGPVIAEKVDEWRKQRALVLERQLRNQFEGVG